GATIRDLSRPKWKCPGDPRRGKSLSVEFPCARLAFPAPPNLSTAFPEGAPPRDCPGSFRAKWKYRRRPTSRQVALDTWGRSGDARTREILRQYAGKIPDSRAARAASRKAKERGMRA